MNILLDECDQHLLDSHNWNVTDRGYVYAWHDDRTIYLHRMVIDAREGETVDHINHNPADNRRQNLRIATQSQQNFNRRPQAGHSSKYKGVGAEKGKWSAYIQINGKKRRLGMFKTEREAALAYNKAAKELAGEFALLNMVA